MLGVDGNRFFVIDDEKIMPDVVERDACRGIDASSDDDRALLCKEALALERYFIQAEPNWSARQRHEEIARRMKLAVAVVTDAIHEAETMDAD